MNLHPGKSGWPAFYALQARTCRNPALRAYYQAGCPAAELAIGAAPLLATMTRFSRSGIGSTNGVLVARDARLGAHRRRELEPGVRCHCPGALGRCQKKENSCLMLEASISTRTDKLATCYSMIFNERSRYTLLSR